MFRMFRFVFIGRGVSHPSTHAVATCDTCFRGWAFRFLNPRKRHQIDKKCSGFRETARCAQIRVFQPSMCPMDSPGAHMLVGPSSTLEGSGAAVAIRGSRLGTAPHTPRGDQCPPAPVPCCGTEQSGSCSPFNSVLDTGPNARSPSTK